MFINVLKFFFSSFQSFWSYHPALLYGLLFVLACQSALSFTPILLLPLCLLLLPLLPSKKFVLALIWFGYSYGYVWNIYQFPDLPSQGMIGNGHLSFSSVTSAQTHFGRRWLYRGMLKSFQSDHPIARNIPITLSIADDFDTYRPIANQDYFVRGRLKKTAHGNYHFSIGRNEPMYPVANSGSFAEYRYQAKKALTDYLNKNIQHRRSATFLSGIATGDFDDRLMKHYFSRFGVQHIMAISGFHFAILASLFSFIFRLMLPQKKAILILAFLLTSYFFFLGISASVMRAWLTIVIALIGLFLKKQAVALNSLGIALIAVLLLDPLQIQSLGFQFSFAVTAAILLFYAGCDLFLQKLFVKRNLSQMVEMDIYNQHGYCVLAFFRQALALTVAVNLIALPITLFYFQKFPLLSLIYNLFFPFFVSISLMLLCLGLLTGFLIPFIGKGFHLLNSYYTEFVLDFTYFLPERLDIVWHGIEITFYGIIIYLTIVFGLAPLLYRYLALKQEEKQDWAFI